MNNDKWPCENPACDNWFVPKSPRHKYCCAACGRADRVQSHYLPVIFEDEADRKQRLQAKQARLGRKLTYKELRRL